VQEIESGEWAIGGNPLSAADVKQMAAGGAQNRPTASGG
jgi:hypothetical protein